MIETLEPQYTIAGAPDLGIDVDDFGRVILRQIHDGKYESDWITIAPGDLPRLAGLFAKLHKEWKGRVLYHKPGSQ